MAFWALLFASLAYRKGARNFFIGRICKMAKYEENNPVFQVLIKAVHEVVLCYNTMPNAYKTLFGKSICEEIGECGTYLNEVVFQKNPSTMIRKLEVADHHLQNVKFWVNQAPNMSFVAKDGIVKYSIPLERSACCSKTLKELGCLIGGWQSTLYDRKGGSVQQSRA